MAALSPALNAFGDRLLQELVRAGHAQAFISPLSIARALGMLLNGTEPGSPASSQLLSVVYGGSQLSVEHVSQALQLGAALVQGSDEEGQAEVLEGNSVWVHPGFQLQPAFRQAMAQRFSAQVESISSAEAINAWCAAATRGKISRVLDTVDGAACILVNALYFRGLWLTPFHPHATQPMPFHHLRQQQAAGSTQQQPPQQQQQQQQQQSTRFFTAMMYHCFSGGGLWGQRSDGVQLCRYQAALPGGSGTTVPCIAVQLPYKGGQFAAVAAMPEGELHTGSNGPLQLANGVPYVPALAACRSALLAGSLTPLKVSDDIHLWLPRFEISCCFELTHALNRMGVTAAFQADSGSLTRIAAVPGGSSVGGLCVGSVIHKVYIKADEQGTEAAAVTAIAMFGCAQPPPAVRIKFDRPFVFGVVHVGSGAALFAGEVREPEAAL